MQGGDHGTITGKLTQFFIIMGIDIVASSFSNFKAMQNVNRGTDDFVDLSAKPNIKLNVEEQFFFAFSGVGAFSLFCLFFWAFSLMWKTFLFKFGLLGRLAKEFPSLWFVPLYFVAFGAEKGYRIVSFENHYF